MNDLFNIKDYVVVITGGTGVLGRTIACWQRGAGCHPRTQGRSRQGNC